MKLIIAVVQNKDADAVVDALVAAEYRATRFASTGGFLRRGNTTIMVGVQDHQVDHVIAAATSATREARNGGEFLARIARETGIRPRVIAGPEEARLIHQAAVYGVDVGTGRAAVIDIGGGSVEITLGNAASIQLARSFKIGVIRLTERFVKSDPLAGRDERKLSKFIEAEVDRHCEQIAAIGYDRVIGTSGTILSIGAVAATLAALLVVALVAFADLVKRTGRMAPAMESLPPPPPTRAVIELLGGALPNAKVETLKGAGHMSPFTHPAELNRMILDHLAAQR